MSRTWLIGLAVGGAALVALIVGIAVMIFSSSGDRLRSIGKPSEGSQAAKAGMQAPGTAELRQLGCGHALVIDMARVLGDAGRIREGEPRFMVTCDLDAAAGELTCERVAAAYFGAIGGVAEGDVSVRVLRAGSIKPACSRLFAPTGADLGAFPRAP